MSELEVDNATFAAQQRAALGLDGRQQSPLARGGGIGGNNAPTNFENNFSMRTIFIVILVLAAIVFIVMAAVVIAKQSGNSAGFYAPGSGIESIFHISIILVSY